MRSLKKCSVKARLAFYNFRGIIIPTRALRRVSFYCVSRRFWRRLLEITPDQSDRPRHRTQSQTGAENGHSLRVRAIYAVTLKADVQSTSNRVSALLYSKSAQSPNWTYSRSSNALQRTATASPESSSGRNATFGCVPSRHDVIRRHFPTFARIRQGLEGPCCGEHGKRWRCEASQQRPV